MKRKELKEIKPISKVKIIYIQVNIVHAGAFNNKGLFQSSNRFNQRFSKVMKMKSQVPLLSRNDKTGLFGKDKMAKTFTQNLE